MGLVWGGWGRGVASDHLLRELGEECFGVSLATSNCLDGGGSRRKCAEVLYLLGGLAELFPGDDYVLAS